MARAKQPSMAPQRDVKGEFLLALQSELGDISAACDATQVGREQYAAWCEEDPWFARMAQEVRERNLDRAERKLQALIQTGDLGAIKYYLDRQGKTRGYGEQSTLDVRGTVEDGTAVAVLDWLKQRGVR